MIPPNFPAPSMHKSRAKKKAPEGAFYCYFY